MSNTKENSKRQTRREQMRRKEMRSRYTWIGIVTLAASFVAFLIIYPNFAPLGSISTPEAISRPNVKFNGTGDPNAPIRIDEYSDFQCPYCRVFTETTESNLLEQFVATGKVYFVYNSFGKYIGSESVNTAEAAYCAGDQEKFWEMHDLIFANQTGENVGQFSDRYLTALAETLNLDMTAYQSCYDGNNYKDLIAQDELDGRAGGVEATPSFVLSYSVGGVVKTRLIQGAETIDTFQREIEAALAEMGK
ncbi:MAG: thioredoxin domain-containing protein [Chloroflexi bacterium]|nr:thioredoxin domain-containing protein [Chloroflexota bacterium]